MSGVAWLALAYAVGSYAAVGAFLRWWVPRGNLDPLQRFFLWLVSPGLVVVPAAILAVLAFEWVGRAVLTGREGDGS